MSTDTSLSVSDSGTQRRRIILSIISARRRTARITAPVLPRFIQTRRDDDTFVGATITIFKYGFGNLNFSFNAQHFTAQMLEDTKHDFELEPLEDTVVSLDWRMTGISEAEYRNDPERALRRIDEKKLNFGFVIRPFEK